MMNRKWRINCNTTRAECEKAINDFFESSKMEKYYDKLKENECNDLDPVSWFNNKFSKLEIEIKTKFQEINLWFIVLR